MPVYVHFCYRDEEVHSENYLCPEPPSPVDWFLQEPTPPGTKYFNYMSGNITYWAVSCE